MAFYTAADYLPDHSIGYLVRRCHQLGQAAMDPLFAQHGLTSMQWSALVAVMLGRATTCAELAREISYDPGATTRLVDSLEAQGWATRQRDSVDRRVVKLALTEAGTDLARAVLVEAVGLWNGWLADWDAAELSMLIDRLQRLRDTLEAAAAGEIGA